MMPRAGGQPICLPARGIFAVVGLPLWLDVLPRDPDRHHRAAVAVAFARASAASSFPTFPKAIIFIAPIDFGSTGYAISLSTAQLVGIGLILLLTATNMLGLQYGKIIQNVFTVAKTGALLGLIVLGLILGYNATAVQDNLATFWTPHNPTPIVEGVDGVHRVRAVRGHLRVADGFAVLVGCVE